MLIVASDAHRAHHPREPFLDRGRLDRPARDPRAGRPHPRRDRRRRARRRPRRRGRSDSDPIVRVHPPRVPRVPRTRARTLARDDGTRRVVRSGRVRPARSATSRTSSPSTSSPSSAGTRTTPTRSSPAPGRPRSARSTSRSPRGTRSPTADEHVAYALARPPGHHAAADSFAGYCYLNNAAIAAQAWTDRGARVAILDVDYHHGNGTQQIFYDRDDVLFVSLHADPAFEYPFFLGFADERGPGRGRGLHAQLPAAGRHRLGRVRHRAHDARSRPCASSRPTRWSCRSASTPRSRTPTRSELVADDYPRIGAAHRPRSTVRRWSCRKAATASTCSAATSWACSASSVASYSPSDSVRIVKNGAASSSSRSGAGSHSYAAISSCGTPAGRRPEQLEARRPHGRERVRRYRRRRRRARRRTRMARPPALVRASTIHDQLSVHRVAVACAGTPERVPHVLLVGHASRTGPGPRSPPARHRGASRTAGRSAPSRRAVP